MRILWAIKTEVDATVANKKGHVTFYPYVRLSPGIEGSLYVVNTLEEAVLQNKKYYEAGQKSKQTFEKYVDSNQK